MRDHPNAILVKHCYDAFAVPNLPRPSRPDVLAVCIGRGAG
jgi:hypothetical protein